MKLPSYGGRQGGQRFRHRGRQHGREFARGAAILAVAGVLSRAEATQERILSLALGGEGAL